MSDTKIKELQNKLDINKWIDSESKQQDQCGNYDYCKLCDKQEENPCATAKLKSQTSANAIHNEVNESTDFKSLKKNNTITFTQKLETADSELLNRYNEIKTYLLSKKGVKCRMAKTYESFSIGRNLIARFTIIRTSLRLSLATEIDEDKYPHRKFPFTDYSDKKSYAKIPFLFPLKNDTRVKNAKIIIDDVYDKFKK